MMQEARNTDRHGGWASARLRDNAISFVSAGTLSREEQEYRPAPDSSSDEDVDNEPEDQVEEEPDEAELIQEPQAFPPTNEILQATDSMHISEPPKNLPQHANGHKSSSDEDELVFGGRNAPIKKTQPKPMLISKPIATESSTDIAGTSTVSKDTQVPRPTSHELHDDNESVLTAIKKPEALSMTPQLPTSSDAAQSSAKQRPVNSRNLRGWGGKRAEEDAILQDYIENMAKEEQEEEEEEESSDNKPYRRNETFRFYDGAAETNVKVQIKANGKQKQNEKHPKQAIDWSSDDLEAFDDLSTTDEDVEEISQVLRYRERPSGPQYLVTALGQTASDAKWVLQTNLTSSTAIEEIQVYEEIQDMQIDIESEDSEDSSNGGEEALEDLIEDIESEDDENARIFEHTARMTDEELARTLAKQEELGMGGDELMLFNEQQFNDDTEDDIFAAEEGFIAFSMGQHTSNRSRTKRNRRQRDSFPPASAFADALEQDPYGAFDVMDFDRPSLRPKRKSKNTYPFDLELSDEDLQQQLVNSWSKDRQKKATRKQEKMAARTASLLESSYRNNPEIIKAEIRRFLVEDVDSLDLAPMENHTRASVHRLAKSLKLHSRSEGKDGVGAGRFPVLTKTPQTPHYSIDTIWQIDNLMNLRKFFPKHAGGSYKGPKATKVPGLKKGRDRGGTAAASYANGEIVGGTAPELAADNKGRQLLERMGWMSGMGIGKEGNEGTLEHVKHVVKTNKAGLG